MTYETEQPLSHSEETESLKMTNSRLIPDLSAPTPDEIKGEPSTRSIKAKHLKPLDVIFYWNRDKRVYCTISEIRPRLSGDKVIGYLIYYSDRVGVDSVDPDAPFSKVVTETEKQ